VVTKQLDFPSLSLLSLAPAISEVCQKMTKPRGQSACLVGPLSPLFPFFHTSFLHIPSVKERDSVGKELQAWPGFLFFSFPLPSSLSFPDDPPLLEANSRRRVRRENRRPSVFPFFLPLRLFRREGTGAS